MSRKPGRLPLPRPELVILVKQHLERAGTDGLTKQDLLTAIGPERTSLQTIQRVLDDLRSDTYEAQLTCSGADRRWRLEAPLAMSLEAPDAEDLLAVLLAQSLIERLALPPLRERFAKFVEEIDERVRRHASSTDLPTRKAMTSSLTLGTRIDPRMLSDLGAACRRRRVRIRYASPWQDTTDAGTWLTIEPWALHMYDGAIYLRAWANAPQQARTYRLAHVEAVESVDEMQEPKTARRPIPTDVWGDEGPAFGIDRDRPGIAVIQMRGGLARWVARVVWHPEEQDVWLEPNELLERTVAYRSCRELARRLASVIDGVVSIDPPALRDEVFGLFRKSPAARNEQMINS